jgi:3-methyladenine DNA glycosylase/8-oxoguanine DNA glycosylase
MVAIAEPWRPYRTLACRFLWRSLDGVADPLNAD